MSTIDPIIVETLNLNQRRMSHIHEILHDGKSHRLQQLKAINNSFHNSHRQKDKNHSSLLPQLTRRNQTLQISKPSKRNNKQYNTVESSRRISILSHRQKSNGIEKSEGRSTSKLDNNSSSIAKKIKTKTIDDQTIPISQRNLKSQPRKSLSTVRSKFISNKNSPYQTPSQIEPSSKLSEANDEVILQESLIGKLQKKTDRSKVTNRLIKTKLMVNDYMGNLVLKKSKSMNLDSKDICRAQVQKIIAELTPIQRLEDAEKKMRRIKRRHQNLAHFDQKYYSRLNQMDFPLLQKQKDV